MIVVVVLARLADQGGLAVTMMPGIRVGRRCKGSGGSALCLAATLRVYRDKYAAGEPENMNKPEKYL